MNGFEIKKSDPLKYVKKELDDQTCVYHTLWNTKLDKMVSSAMVTKYVDEVSGCTGALLWIIVTPEKYRKKGYAITLLVQMQECYDQIETQWLNNKGKELCLKCGFEYITPNGNNLVWIKEDDNAGKNMEN